MKFVVPDDDLRRKKQTMSILSRLDDFVTSLKTFSRSFTSRSSTANKKKEKEEKHISSLFKSEKKEKKQTKYPQFVKDERLFEELMLLRMIS